MTPALAGMAPSAILGLALATPGCRPEAPSGHAPVASGEAAGIAGGAASPAATAAAAPCPVVPLRLELRAADRPPYTSMALDAAGRLEVAGLGGAGLTARLDPRGCLAGADGLWAELTPSEVLWTAHAALVVDGAALVLDAGARLRIGPEGEVERLGADGGVEDLAGVSLSLEGYRPEARCAGLLLLATFLQMAPSMAVVDGHPARAPVPHDSRCRDYPRP